ncbi:hypothetical protein OSTOST_18869, partial [Ostertagia ostertagi]
MEGDPVATPICGLTYGQLTPKPIKCFSGSDDQDFESWLRKFEDVVRMVSPPLPDQLRINTLVGFLEGGERDIIHDLSDTDENSYAAPPQFRSLARQQLSDCKQGPTGSAREFADRIKQIVEKVTRGQPKHAQNERLLDEFQDRLIPTLRFHAVVKATTYESLLNDVASAITIFPGTQPTAPPPVRVVAARNTSAPLDRTNTDKDIPRQQRRKLRLIILAIIDQRGSGKRHLTRTSFATVAKGETFCHYSLPPAGLQPPQLPAPRNKNTTQNENFSRVSRNMNQGYDIPAQMRVVWNHVDGAQCSQRTPQMRRCISSAISTQPMLMMGKILRRSDIEATLVGDKIVRTKSCAPISGSMYQLLPFNSSCFSSPAVRVSLPNGSYWKTFLDPVGLSAVPFRVRTKTILMRAQIIDIEMEEEYLDVTAQLETSDGVRFRAYLLSSRNGRIAVGAVLHGRASQSRACSNRILLHATDELGWLAARVTGCDFPDYNAITVTVVGSQIQLNADQVNAVNPYNKEYCPNPVRNIALDVIGAKIAELQSKHIRAVRYVSEILAQGTLQQSPFALHTLMENFHSTHRHLLDDDHYKRFKRFSDERRQLREFMFSNTQTKVVDEEYKKLMQRSWGLKVLTSKFIKLYKPNVYLCTVSTALNLTRKKGLWYTIGTPWYRFILDEASMVPEATPMTLISRFPEARITLIGDSKLDLVTNHEWTPICHLRTVYRPHIEMMYLNSRLFYDGSLTCGAATSLRQAGTHQYPSYSVQSVTGSHSNIVEATAAHVLLRFLLAKGFAPAQIMVICLYRDQKLLCERILQQTDITVDSAQGKENSVIILCTTRTENVALSCAKDGYLPYLQAAAVRNRVFGWCRKKRLTIDLHFFDNSLRPPIQP